jgi:Ca2+-binding EF-hand superfamily protein
MTDMSENPYLLTLPQLISAKKKIGQLAAFYDPEKCSFKGFDASALTPTEFREQLRRNFLIRLTDAELGAIVLLFDKDGDREIDSSEFINEFFRLGKQQKKKFFLEQKDLKEQRAANKARSALLTLSPTSPPPSPTSLPPTLTTPPPSLPPSPSPPPFRRAAEHSLRFEKLVESHFPETWTPKEEKSAIRKISKIAFTYDADVGRWLGGGIQGFMDCGEMNPQQFREQLSRNFELRLSPGEVSALMSVFDIDGNGTVDCSEFLFTFFRMGRNEKDRHVRRQMKSTSHLNEIERERVVEREKKYAQYSVAKLTTATAKDEKQAMRKISKAATLHWGDIGGGKSFESADLTPAAFKEQLKRQFLITLSPGELDAMVKIFDTDGDGNISSVEFLTTFFRIGSEGKRKLHRKKLEREEILAKAEVERKAKKIDSAKSLVVTRVNWPDLPNTDEGHNNSTSFLPMSPIKRASTAPMKKSRKPGMAEYLKSTKHKMDPNSSVADMFPRASTSTLDFIRHIEDQERAINARALRTPGSPSPGHGASGGSGFGGNNSFSGGSDGGYTPIKSITNTDGGDSFMDMDGVLPPLA